MRDLRDQSNTLPYGASSSDAAMEYTLRGA
jgi:hypothetical protein